MGNGSSDVRPDETVRGEVGGGEASGFDVDVVVIGSGFGGSVTALRLAEKGYRVTVVEAGRRYTTPPDASSGEAARDHDRVAAGVGPPETSSGAPRDRDR